MIYYSDRCFFINPSSSWLYNELSRQESNNDWRFAVASDPDSTNEVSAGFSCFNSGLITLSFRKETIISVREADDNLAVRDMMLAISSTRNGNFSGSNWS